MAERVGQFLRIGLTQRGMTAADLAEAWALIRPADEGERGWQMRLKRALADQPTRGLTVWWINSLLRARPRLDAVGHLLPDWDAYVGETVSFIPGVLALATSLRGWSLDSLASHAGLDTAGRLDLCRGRPLKTDDAARVLRLLAGRVPAGSRAAELQHIDRHHDPLRGVDVAAAFAERGWTTVAAALVAGISPATASAVRAGRGRWESRAAVRDAIRRTPPRPPEPPAPSPAPRLEGPDLRHQMNRRGLLLQDLVRATGVGHAALLGALQGRARQSTWEAIDEAFKRIDILPGADRFLAPTTASIGRRAGPRLDRDRVAAELVRAGLAPPEFAAAAGLSHQAACDARLGRQVTPATLAKCLAVLNGGSRLRWAHSSGAVRRRLEALGWRQEDLAVRSALSEATVSTFLNGNSVRAATRWQIDIALGDAPR